MIQISKSPHFGDCLLVEFMFVRPLSVQTKTFPGTGTSRSTGALIRRRFRNRHHVQMADAASRIVTVLFDKAGIDHKNDAVDGYGRFRNVCRQHHLSNIFGRRFENFYLQNFTINQSIDKSINQSNLPAYPTEGSHKSAI